MDKYIVGNLYSEFLICHLAISLYSPMHAEEKSSFLDLDPYDGMGG